MILQLAIAFFASFLLCAGMIWLGLPYASRLALAVPNSRSSHDTPTPQSGGLFLALTIVLALVFCGWNQNFLIDLFPILLLIISLTLIGWLDDRRGLPVLLRLSLFSGISIAYAFFRAPTLNGFISPYLGIFLSACFLIVMINVTNFMDGIDGMVVAEFVPMSVLIAILTGGGVIGPLYGFQAIIIAGALLGFFIFNRPKAKIFLGDSGSLVAGFIAGILLLELSEKQGPHAILFLPLYFLCDAGLTLLRRLLRGEAIWKAHREHFYQQAFDNGQSNWSIIIRLALCNIVLCALFYSTTLLPFWADVIGLIFALGLMVLLLVSLSRNLRIYERKSRGTV